MNVSLEDFGLAPLKREGGLFLPFHPTVQNYLETQSNTRLALELKDLLEQLFANQKKKPGRKPKAP